MAGLTEPSQWRGVGGKKGGKGRGEWRRGKGGEGRGGMGRRREREGGGKERERVKKEDTAYAIHLLVLPHPRAPIPECTHIRSTRAA